MTLPEPGIADIMSRGMDIYRNLDQAGGTRCVLCIGNFDGVHRGHRKLLAAARGIADASGTPVGVMTFEPHPRRLFRPDDPPFCITPPPVERRLLEAQGVDVLFSLRFDWDFASQSAEQFIANVLDGGIRPSHVVVGYDFRFGQLRSGAADTLRDAGYAVTVVEELADREHQAFSSSRVRVALRHGDLETANRLLGWAWELEGRVVVGNRRGHTLGFPTANLELGETLHPAYGVYAAWARVQGEEAWRPAATNIGIRPMFELPVGQVEAHILDFDRDIYGEPLRVRPVRKIRGEARYASVEELVRQMRIDCRITREMLGVS